jgi:ubiquinone/menaquinone biosynthesis C-methylase UbiE
MKDNPYDELYQQIDFSQKPFGYDAEYLLWRTAQLKKELARYITGKGRILDVGGGFGIMVKFLPGFISTENYYNSDVSSEMLKYSCYQNVLAAGETLPFSDNSFNYVISSDVLEHVSDKKKNLTECFRVLKPKGLLLLSTPRSGWMQEFKTSPFLPFILIDRVLTRLHRRKTKLIVPQGVKDEPSDENWLKETLENIGFSVLDQYRADNHVPWGNGGECKFWRWFADSFVNPRKYGHCTIVISKK